MRLFVMSDIHGMYGSFIRRIEQIDKLADIRNGEDKLILLGDYVDVGLNSYKVVQKIFDLKEELGDNLIVLMGNHDKWFIDFLEGKNLGWIAGDNPWLTLEGFMSEEDIEEVQGILRNSKPGPESLKKASLYCREKILSGHGDLVKWMKKFPFFYETERQIFVHAGIDEEAEDWWKTGTPDEMFIEKYPAEKGKFYKDIVAGHVSVSEIKQDQDFHDIYWDRKSHYYIDGIDSYTRSVRDDNRIIPVLVYSDDDGEEGYYSLSEDGKMTLISNIR